MRQTICLNYVCHELSTGANMLDFAELLLFGAIAGLTIFLGLPMALLQSVSPRKKGFLNALSMGILVFLISDVLANAWAPTKLAVTSAYTGTGSPSDAALDLLALFGGLGLGLLGLASYEQRYIRRITLALKSFRPRLEGMTDDLNGPATRARRSEEHTSELQSQSNLVCRL